MGQDSGPNSTASCKDVAKTTKSQAYYVYWFGEYTCADWSKKPGKYNPGFHEKVDYYHIWMRRKELFTSWKAMFYMTTDRDVQFVYNPSKKETLQFEMVINDETV